VTSLAGRLRRQLPGILALVLLVTTYYVVRLPQTSAAEQQQMASKYKFTPTSIAMPSGFREQSIRQVNQKYQHIDAWISAVGAGIAMNDLDGDGLANDLCITDPRIDQAVVTPTPGARANRYAPFALNPAPLPMNSHIAPMGCVPGDFNEDGRTDLLVYYWGRTPVVFLQRSDARALTMAAYRPAELAPGQNSANGSYTGPQWNSNAAAVDDFDGDGHEDIFIGNYFPPGPMLDPAKDGGVVMNRSLSNAQNGGRDYFFRFTGGTGGTSPTSAFQQLNNVLPNKIAKGWTLAAAATDLDGDQLPELYIGHDFGPDELLHNLSTPGHIRFAQVKEARTPLTPKSKRIGGDSFKGMGVDFGDLNGDGLYDMFVSNISSSFGLEESNFAFMSAAHGQRDLRTQLNEGKAPWKDRSGSLNLAWSGWGWDNKIADFNNSGNLAIAQATGFVKGDVNRWAQLQELATSNDNDADNPAWWPHMKAGDDIAGHQRMAFFVKGPDGRYVNLADRLGLGIPVPTRGIATGDMDGDGRLDLAIARQWDEPVFYHNDAPSPGAFLGLRLCRDGSMPAHDGSTSGTAGTAGALPASGSAVVGAQVTVTTPDGHRYVSRVDGGSGHSGKRSNEVHLGLGQNVTGPVQVHLRWRDRSGQVRNQDLQLTPGNHTLMLGSQAKEM
jgi:hypothetical protein